ncbi:MAG: glycoside hydrolase family 3 N-terminal domain-containing protein, partial [Promethearchaeota archaeon]
MSKDSKLDLLELSFMDSKLDLEERVDDLLERLTLQEKFRLLSGRHTWYTKPIRRLGIKPFAMFDGPHGVRVETRGDIQSTYFPSSICRAATWNLKLNEQFGIAVAKEVRNVGAQMWLAPAINIQRTPLCGRNFEY